MELNKRNDRRTVASAEKNVSFKEFDRFHLDADVKQRIYTLMDDGQNDTLRHQDRRGRKICGNRIAICAAAFAIFVGGGIGLWLYAQRSTIPSVELSSHTTELEVDLSVMQSFELDGALYHQASSEELTEYGLPATVDEELIGPYLGTLGKEAGEELMGKDVYAYGDPAARVFLTVQTAKGYDIYLFGGFIKYRDNTDEDASAYLALYGVEDESDIESIDIYDYPDTTSEHLVRTITSRKIIGQFYDMYCSLTDASEAYFDAIGIHPALSSQSLDPPAAAVSDGNQSAVSCLSPNASDAYEEKEGDALSDCKTIALHLTNGYTLRVPFYPRIGFLSRYKPSSAGLSLLISICES